MSGNTSLHYAARQGARFSDGFWGLDDAFEYHAFASLAALPCV
jgi:hypothetical protein